MMFFIGLGPSWIISAQFAVSFRKGHTAFPMFSFLRALVASKISSMTFDIFDKRPCWDVTDYCRQDDVVMFIIRPYTQNLQSFKFCDKIIWVCGNIVWFASPTKRTNNKWYFRFHSRWYSFTKLDTVFSRSVSRVCSVLPVIIPAHAVRLFLTFTASDGSSYLG